jgi:hypothetical protein
MDDRYSTQKLLELRKLTRAIADLMRSQLKEYLATLSLLFRPGIVLGEHVSGGVRGAVKSVESNYQELKGLYENIAASRLYSLSREIPVPLEIMSTTPEIVPMDYTYVTKGDPEGKTITISSPLKWVLCYASFPPSRLRELLGVRSRTSNELTSYVVHYLALHTVLSKLPGLSDLLSALHFRVVTEQTPDLGPLPLTCICSAISTERPPDEVIIESTEISGMDLFEEIVTLEDLKAWPDPLKDRLLELVQKQGVALP